MNDGPPTPARAPFAREAIGLEKSQSRAQEVIDFCARKGILPECRMIRPDQINEAFATLEKADIPYRFVMDLSALEAPRG